MAAAEDEPEATPAGHAATRALWAGAAAAVAFTLYRGRTNPHWVLTALFVGWVAAPFGGAAVARHAARAWPAPARHVTDAVAVSLAAVTIIAFALDAVRPFTRGAVAYVIVPAAGWLFVVAGAIVAAALARRGAD